MMSPAPGPDECQVTYTHCTSPDARSRAHSAQLIVLDRTKAVRFIPPSLFDVVRLRLGQGCLTPRVWSSPRRRSLRRRRLAFLEQPVALVLPERTAIAHAPVSSRQVEEPFAGKPVGAANHQGAEQALAVSDAAFADLAQQLRHPWRPPVDHDAVIPQALAELPVDQALAARGWLVDGRDAERLTDPSQVGRDALQRVGRAVQRLSQGRLTDA